MSALVASGSIQARNLWFYVFKLLRLRWAIFAHGFKRATPLRKALTLLLGLLVLAAFVGSYALTTYLLGLVDSPLVQESGVDLSAFVSAIPTLIVSGVFLGILLFSFGILLQGLYLANDMDFLLTAPIPMRAVFLTKLLQAILPNFILVMAFSLPVLLGLGVSAGYNLLYFPLVLLVLAFLSLAAAGISSLLVMAVVRVFPAKRVVEALAFLAAIFFIVLSQLTNLMGINSESLTPSQISAGTQALTNFNNPWSPLAWAGRGLVDLGEGRWLWGIFFLALTLGLSGGVFWFALNAAERLYYTGWASLQVSAQPKKTRRVVAHSPRSHSGAGLLRRLLPPGVIAILRKDFLELQRDLRVMSQVIKPLITGIIFAFLLLRDGEPAAGNAASPEQMETLFQSAQAHMGILLSLFVGWMVILNLALISFSMEGKNYWMIQTAPLSAGKQLAAKFLSAYLPSLIVSWLFLLVFVVLQKVPPSAIAYAFCSVAWVLAGLDGIIMVFGVRGANLSWSDPGRMSDGVVTTIGMIASFIYLVAVTLLFFAPPVGLPLLGLSEGTGQWIGLLAGGTCSLLCAILPLSMLKNRISRIGEA